MHRGPPLPPLVWSDALTSSGHPLHPPPAQAACAISRIVADSSTDVVLGQYDLVPVLQQVLLRHADQIDVVLHSCQVRATGRRIPPGSQEGVLEVLHRVAKLL